ncbi:MAG: hypothetical protein JSS10_03020 [Verrucomicrobia bacterium]|nr:hypothetical protein [Verrucomicrobiota bacterium]
MTVKAPIIDVTYSTYNRYFFNPKNPSHERFDVIPAGHLERWRTWDAAGQYLVKYQEGDKKEKIYHVKYESNVWTFRNMHTKHETKLQDPDSLTRPFSISYAYTILGSLSWFGATFLFAQAGYQIFNNRHISILDRKMTFSMIGAVALLFARIYTSHVREQAAYRLAENMVRIFRNKLSTNHSVEKNWRFPGMDQFKISHLFLETSAFDIPKTTK